MRGRQNGEKGEEWNGMEMNVVKSDVFNGRGSLVERSETIKNNTNEMKKFMIPSNLFRT